MKLQISACLHADCDFTCYVRKDQAGTIRHTEQTQHTLFKEFSIPPGVLMPNAAVLFDRLRWTVEEATLNSAVMNNHVDGTQTVAVRLVLTRKPRQ